MKTGERKFPKNKGFTLIEMMIFLFIFSITVVAFYRTFTFSTQSISGVKNRLGATKLAEEKMEIIHNLPYASIGTQGGIPNGSILQYEVDTPDGQNYYVHTFIELVADPLDTSVPNNGDYKVARVQVYWEDNNPAKSVSLVAMFTPPTIQTNTGGILSLHVLDSNGVGIPQATVVITNNNVNPHINISALTDNSGNIFLPGAPASSQAYNIQVSKNGYFSVQTYSPYPTSPTNPVDVNASVVNGVINADTITTDKVSNIAIATVDPLGNSVPNIDFSLQGGRIISNTVATPPVPVYAFSNASLNSGSTGALSFSSMSSGIYTLTYGNSAGNSNYVFLHMYPAMSQKNVFNAAAGSTLNEAAVVADKSVNSLLVTVTDSSTSLPIAGAAVELKDPNSTYDVTLTADAFGQAYFPDSSGPLAKQQYNLNVSVSGYTTVSNQSVNVDKLTNSAVSLSAN